jgi:hypothetical protein
MFRYLGRVRSRLQGWDSLIECGGVFLSLYYFLENLYHNQADRETEATTILVSCRRGIGLEG